MKKALPVLVNILEKEARGWFLHFREKVVADLKAQNLSEYEVEKVRSYLVYYFSSLFLFVLSYKLSIYYSPCNPSVKYNKMYCISMVITFDRKRNNFFP